jgi:hypothetical protein
LVSTNIKGLLLKKPSIRSANVGLSEKHPNPNVKTTLGKAVSKYDKHLSAVKQRFLHANEHILDPRHTRKVRGFVNEFENQPIF